MSPGEKMVLAMLGIGLLACLPAWLIAKAFVTYGEHHTAVIPPKTTTTPEMEE